MRLIIANIYTLTQHISDINSHAENYRPDKCPNCGVKKLRCHGYYFRKSDRENSAKKTLNPIPIPRFFCANCRRTCSVLPECIPPRRWYLWHIQQVCILFCLAGKSFRAIDKCSLPSRHTISRWFRKLKSDFALHAINLKSYFSWLGAFSAFERFWKNCLAKISLAKVMLLLNNSGVYIP